MSVDSDDGFAIFLVVCGLIFAFITWIVGGVNGTNLGRELMRQEAVTKGYAEYVPDKDGKPEWRWKEIK